VEEERNHAGTSSGDGCLVPSDAVVGPKRHIVRRNDPVAIGGEADIARTSLAGHEHDRDIPLSDICPVDMPMTSREY
jgi:hypothetical protein